MRVWRLNFLFKHERRFHPPHLSKTERNREDTNELPAIGKRSELKIKAGEIAILIDEARQAAMDMEKESVWNTSIQLSGSRGQRILGGEK